MSLSPLIAIHLVTALGATAVGPVALWARRTGHPARVRLHRAAGYAFTTLMLCAALSALFIRDDTLPNWHGFTAIHILIPLTLLGLWQAFRYLHKGDIAGHRRIMRQVYLGACLVAGAFTLLPGRYLGDLVWTSLGLV
ncbi:MAG: DUF2306 domain-containing protein [Pigmentiphaga sp.]|nr:DUF2306 domain-containing protein [Pigmentiphaga sp.]